MTMTQVGQLFLLYWCTAASCVHDRGEIGECSQTCSSSELQTALYPARQTEASAHPKPTNTDDQQAWLNKNGVRTHWLGKALLVCFKPKSWKDLQLMHIWLRPITTWIMPSQQALTIFVSRRTWDLLAIDQTRLGWIFQTCLAKPGQVFKCQQWRQQQWCH